MPKDLQHFRRDIDRRFVRRLANLTGLPAVSAPVGGDRDGMPVGLQLIGDAWDEACVLQAAASLERSGVARALSSEATIDLLG